MSHNKLRIFVQEGNLSEIMNLKRHLACVQNLLSQTRRGESVVSMPWLYSQTYARLIRGENSDHWAPVSPYSQCQKLVATSDIHTVKKNV